MARSQELAAVPAARFTDPTTLRDLTAYFHESAPAAEIANQFQLPVGTVRAIVRDFARDPDVNACCAAGPGRKTSPK